MSQFGARLLNDREIWRRIEALESRRQQLESLLARPEVSTDPERLPALAREFSDLGAFCELANQVRHHEAQLDEAHDIAHEEPEFQQLADEHARALQEATRRLYELLLERGYLEEEREDEKDLEILRFIDYAGPEYAWRLGINVNSSEEEARRRLEQLRAKGLLERVQGTMLDNYHRESGWTKHMNHTYYQLTREGEHYLRELDRDV